MSERRRAVRRVAALLLVACGLACFGRSEDAWVVEIDGVRIGVEQLRARLEPRWEAEPEADREELALQELEDLVTEQVALNRAKALGIEVAEEEAARRAQELFAGEEAALDPGYLEVVRRELLIDRTALVDLADRVEVSESALLHHFQADPQRYAEPERVEVRHIVVQEEALARQILSELRGGDDFAMLARAHSLSPEARDGGLLPPFARGEMPEVFDHAFKQKPGKLSDVLESPYGFHILRVERVLPAAEPDFEMARAAIRADLEQQKLAELRREWLRELRRNAEVRVNERVLEQLQ